MDQEQLEQMSVEDLQALGKRVEAAMIVVEKRRKEEARLAVEAVAKEYGMSIKDLVAVGPLPKYRDPKNPANSWAGRGARPKWFKERLNEGVSKKDMKVMV